MASTNENANWWRRIFEFMIGMGRKRHLTIARLLIILGIGCFAAPSLWVQLAILVSDNLAQHFQENPPSQGFSETEFAGLLCIVFGVVIFWYFEKREVVLVEGDGGKILAIPDKSFTLEHVIQKLLQGRRKPVRLEGFTEARLSAYPTPGEYSFVSLYDAVSGAVSLTSVENEDEPTITLDEQNERIIVRANYG